MSDAANTGCLKCGQPTTGDYPHCPACMRQLTAAGFCKWCGLRPRKAKTAPNQSKYCEQCQSRMLTLLQPRREAFQAAYRGQDARENTYETKHG